MKAQDSTVIRHIDVEIDDNIKLPKWVEKRIEWIYKGIARKGAASEENIMQFCKCVIASIKPFVKGKITCSTECKGDVLHIFFGAESKQERKYLQ